ncbi:MAG: hypothetical protein HGA45_27115, partial [Chloroflexales bacterium]|nr:hypothetical protein [Chloroflexales bacterium]
MRLQSTLFILCMVALLITTGGPALAQGGNPVVIDQGNNIYLVDGTQGLPPDLLPADEVAKIARLQGVPSGANVLLSPVSPDDKTVLAIRVGGKGFLNLEDGTSVPFTSIDTAGQLSNFFWLDDDTLALYAVSKSTGLPTLYSSDRRTGQGRELGALGLANQVPVFASSDGRKVLLASVPPVNQANPGAALVAQPADTLDPAAPVVASYCCAWRLGLMPQAPAGTRAHALTEFAALFDPLGGGKAVIKAGSVLSVLDTATGERREVAQIGPGSVVAEASFSQDGSQLAVVIVVEDGDTSRGLDGALQSELGYRDATGNLPPAESPWLQGNQLVLLDFASGQVRTVRAADGDGALFVGASWSTDNRTLVTRMETPGQLKGRRHPQYQPQYRSGSHLRFWDAATLKEIRRLEQSEIDHASPTPARQIVQFVSPDEVIIESQNRLDRQPFYYNLRSGELRDLADRAGSYFSVRATRRSREIVFVYTSFTDPAELYRMGWDGTGLARLTWDNEAMRQYSRTKQQPVAFTLRDGT